MNNLPQTYEEMQQLGRELFLDLTALEKPPVRLIMTLTGTQTDRCAMRKTLGIVPYVEVGLRELIRDFKQDAALYDAHADFSFADMLSVVGKQDWPFRVVGNQISYKTGPGNMQYLLNATLTFVLDTPAVCDRYVRDNNLRAFMDAVKDKLSENTKTQNDLIARNAKLTRLQQTWDNVRP